MSAGTDTRPLLDRQQSDQGRLEMGADLGHIAHQGPASNFVRGAIRWNGKDPSYGDRQGSAGPAASGLTVDDLPPGGIREVGQDGADPHCQT